MTFTVPEATRVDLDLAGRRAARPWSRGPGRGALVAGLGASARYLGDAIRSYDDGWGPAVRPEDMVASQRLLQGDHWGDWPATECPALLVHGVRSDTLSPGHTQASDDKPPTAHTHSGRGGRLAPFQPRPLPVRSLCRRGRPGVSC
ncbi:hypothetical protein ACFW6N_04010 [Streptomyces cyaneofuscatus]|uniref:hypothetical protein n=1 Tax=Streptomyces cyaneofuscatus TaxID=66883 RepID=UPI0036BC8A1C